MKAVLAVMSLAWAQMTLCQTYPQWVNNLGGQGGNEVTRSVAVDANNQIYVGGMFAGPTDFDPGPSEFVLIASIDEPYLARYTPSGDLVWARHLAGRGQVSDLAIDGAGNLLVLGELITPLQMDASFTLMPTGMSRDIFVAQYDSDGNLNWAFALGGNGPDRPQALAVDSQDNVVIAGIIAASADLDAGPGEFNVVAGINEDAFVARYSSTGAFQWGHLFEQTASSGLVLTDSARGLAIAGNDDVYVCGMYGGMVDFGPVTLNGTGTDAYIARISNAGAVLWVSSTASTGLRTEHFAIGVDGDGNLVSAGVHTGAADFDPDPVGEANHDAESLDTFLSSYDENGSFRWVRFLSGPGTDWVEDIIVREDGSFSVAGQIGGSTDFDPGPEEEIRIGRAQFDPWFAHFDPDGALISVQHLEGSGHPFQDASGIEAMASTSDGDLIVVGNNDGGLEFDPGASSLLLFPVSDSDGFVARYGPAPLALVFANSFEAVPQP